MAYCAEADLIAGNIPAADGVKKTYVDAASEEMDSYLSAQYVTPISVNVADPRQKQTSLTLKRINAHLASGRLITSMGTGGEDTEVHAYGLMLITESLNALKALASGAPDLYGATKHNQDDEGAVPESDLRGKVFNGDLQSEVDAFYSSAMPNGFFAPRGSYYGA